MGQTILRALLSQQAILVYEIIIGIILVIFIVRFLKQRKGIKKQIEADMEQRRKKSLEESLMNEKRR